MKRLFFLFFLFVSTGCSYTLSVPGDFVQSNPQQFRSESLRSEQVLLVLPSDIKTYKFEKKAYNWAGGSMFPDTLTFDIGSALSSELVGLTNALYGRSAEAPDLQSAKVATLFKPNLIIMPEVEGVSLELPVVRFADIEAEIKIRYSFYDASGGFLASSSIVGHGTKALVFTKQNYVTALENAIRDAVLKSRDLFISVSRGRAAK